MRTCLYPFTIFLLATATAPTSNAEAPGISSSLNGDLGAGYYYDESIVTGASSTSGPTPYAFIDYGRLFCRLDTFGVKTLAIGDGYLEAVGRISSSGYKTNNATLKGLADRKDPSFWGIGSFQTTKFGVFALYGLHDFNRSKGTETEASYIVSIPLGKITVFPVLGCAFQDARFNRYYYGISMDESARSRFKTYLPGEAWNPFGSLTVDVPIYRRFHLNVMAQETFMGEPIRHSPLVSKSSKTTFMISVTYRFGKE